MISSFIEGRPRDIGGFQVRRYLPARARRMVGPFTFFDYIGPADLAPGRGVDVPPHPHIGLATVTYLFEGALVHRDSLGSCQTILPGDINWMTAGSGIAHSERTPKEMRTAGSRMHGLQFWVALPLADEETEAEFHHHSTETLPEIQETGATVRVLSGSAYDRKSPVRTLSPLFFLDVTLSAGSSLRVGREYIERAAFVIDGTINCGKETLSAGQMPIFAPEAEVVLTGNAHSRLVLFGGAPIDGDRHMWWNFVSSSKARIEQASRDWKEGRFTKIPGDDVEFVPLPE